MSALRQRLRRIPLVAYWYQRLRQRRYDAVHETPWGFRLTGLPGVMADGRFERVETELVRRLLPRVELFVDIGAHVGLFTCLARQAGKPAIAVEASAHTARRLLANVSMNGWADTEVLPVALGAASGVATLYGTGTAASLVAGWGGGARNRYLDSLVPVHAADALLLPRLAGRKAFIKMDVEGAEYEVLKGARGMLGAAPSPLWLVEICLTENQPSGCNPSYAQTFDAFFDAGYSAWRVSEPLVPVSRDEPSAWARAGSTPHGIYNYLFAKEDVT
jgi:FkbM family methyltransferase